ncbi:(Fe-S)-binding protein [Megasphaera paucivorans]|uniref:Cysteine-rich domain-containing protein n=1 Tax=Megasphaera paucivorans TaxID=349095 RepID=A0A1G9UP52_9FIRM|nr:(Fe-S)-binding protein [Megasphaera paucivorans]SDM61732.1 Cysteine-rich domain-containing protein [Megasphaera paucivorans]
MTTIRESISLRQINKNSCYFNPGCAMSVYKPEVPSLLWELLKTYWEEVPFHPICCHHDPLLPKGATIINNCAGCDRRFRSLYKGIRTLSIWEVLDSLEDLRLPDYHGLTVSVHDSCGYRHKPQVHNAIRSLLCKMNIMMIETTFSGTRSVCCGDTFYGHVPNEQVEARIQERADQFPCDNVVVTCIGCVRAMTAGGKKPRYLPDLILNRLTEPMPDTLDEYHAKVTAYIEAQKKIQSI